MTRRSNQGQTFTGIQFLPDGRTALTSSTDAILALWDLTSGEILQRFEGHEDWVMDLALSPDGKTVYSSSFDNTVRVWNIATGEQVAVYQPFPDGSTKGLAVSPDGEKILVGRNWLFYIPFHRYDAVIDLLDAGTGEILSHLTGHTSLVNSIAFSPDGRYALSGSADQSVRLWDLNTGDQLAVFYGHTGVIWKVAFSPDGLTGYSTGFDGSMRVWDLREYLGSD